MFIIKHIKWISLTAVLSDIVNIIKTSLMKERSTNTKLSDLLTDRTPQSSQTKAFARSHMIFNKQQHPQGRNKLWEKNRV